MHGAVPTSSYITGDLIGFTVGLAISVLLLALTLRASKLPGTPFANILLALCSLVWNLGGAACIVLLATGLPRGSRSETVAAALQFMGAAVWPIPMIAIWRASGTSRVQRIGCRVLLALASISAVVLTGLLWSNALVGVSPVAPLLVKEFTAYNGSFLLLVGLILLRGALTSRTVRFASLATFFGVLGSTVSIIILEHVKVGGGLTDALTVVSEQSPLLIVLGGFFLFARFRFADLFIRYCLRIVLATSAALALVLLIEAPSILHLVSRMPFPEAARMFLVTTIAAALLLTFAFADQRLGHLINQWIFHAPDYRKAARGMGERLLRLYAESELAAEVENATRNTLELAQVQLRAAETLGHRHLSEIAAGDLIEVGEADPLRDQLPGVELLVPATSGGKTTHVLMISPGPARRGLVTQEVNYLQMVAAQFGSRLDSLRLEREMFERRNRETVLLQQLTEAELRALRAQVNPHFLFNSLNTIANLIVTDPASAETMTLRLAKAFRYVLAHSSQSLSSVAEEVEFLRAYLQIEEARFGERLKVEIDIAADVAAQRIPSLVLQPLVENALKHGLAPKLGPGRLWISARSQNNQVCLKIEDDGVGLRPDMSARANGNNAPAGKKVGGVGLANIEKRLTTLYQDRATFSLEPRLEGGTRATLLIPRENGATSS